MKIFCLVISFIIIIISILNKILLNIQKKCISEKHYHHKINKKSSNDELIKLIESYNSENNISIKNIIQDIKQDNTQ